MVELNSGLVKGVPLKTSYILWGPLLIWIQEPPECLLTIVLYYVIIIYYLKCCLPPYCIM